MRMDVIRKIQRDLGIKSYSTIYKWSKGLNSCPPEQADRLESLTGIPAMKFCLPHKYGNPWVDVEMIYRSKNND